MKQFTHALQDLSFYGTCVGLVPANSYKKCTDGRYYPLCDWRVDRCHKTEQVLLYCRDGKAVNSRILWVRADQLRQLLQPARRAVRRERGSWPVAAPVSISCTLRQRTCSNQCPQEERRVSDVLERLPYSLIFEQVFSILKPFGEG